MRFRNPLIASVIIGAFSAVLGACNAQPVPQATPVAVLGWDKTPSTIVFRLDREIANDPIYLALNRLPICTLYGDGHLLWTNPTPPDGEEVLETYIDDVQFRGFLETIIRDTKFYEIPDYAAQSLPPSENALMESMTLNLNKKLQTVRSYRGWVRDEFNFLYDKCRSLTESPAQFAPTGGWVTARKAAPGINYPQIQWSTAAPFKLSDLAATDKSIWATGPALLSLWNYQRQSSGLIQWVEFGSDQAYNVIVQVPLISRDSPPAPPATPEETATTTP